MDGDSFLQGTLHPSLNEQPEEIKKPRRKPNRKITVLILNKNTTINKRLLGFFKKSLKDLNDAGIIFEWMAVYPEEIDEYKSQKITKFPVLLEGDRKVDGLNNITDFLVNCIKKHYKKHGEKTDIVMDYFKKNLDRKDDDDDDDETKGFERSKDDLMRSMIDKRRNAGLSNTFDTGDASDSDDEKPTKPSTSKDSSNDQQDKTSAVSLLKNKKHKTQDDDLLSKFFENNEETEM